MTGIRASDLLTKREGMGSSGQVFNPEFWISDLTSLSDKVLKADNVGIAIAFSTINSNRRHGDR